MLAKKFFKKRHSPLIPHQIEGQFGLRISLVGAVILLWSQLYLSIVPIWTYGDYYSFAWFVPPIAAFFFSRRWQEGFEPATAPVLSHWILPVAFVVFLALVGLRCIEGVDASWRPPIILHAAFVSALTYGILAFIGGSHIAWKMVPVIVFALSAVPYPYQLEVGLINTLSEWVVEAVGLIFHVFGRPVVVFGGILEYRGTQVEVTEGCSGIQSFHSLVMVALYFGEFFRLRVFHRLLLLALASFVAVSVNIGRALLLAQIRLGQGQEAFDLAHDPVGHTAFAVGGVCLMIAARMMNSSADRKKKVVRVTKTKSKPMSH